MTADQNTIMALEQIIRNMKEDLPAKLRAEWIRGYDEAVCDMQGVIDELHARLAEHEAEHEAEGRAEFAPMAIKIVGGRDDG